MIPLQLDPISEQRLRDLASATDRDAPDLIRQIVRDYLDAQAWERDAPEEWAEASVALSPELLSDDPARTIESRDHHHPITQVRANR